MDTSFAELTQNLPHRPILDKALSYFDDLAKIAIDCGCGAGNESAFLLQQNFIVHAFDPSVQARDICLQKFAEHNNFIFAFDRFESYEFPRASLIIALFSLFFCAPHRVDYVLEKISNALFPEGIFLLQVLGKDDTWAVQESTQFAGFGHRQLEQKFSKEFEILWMDELKGYKPLANGTLKFWHFYTLILKKKA